MTKKDSGFIQIIAIIIIFVIVLVYLGKNPIEIWENIKPIFVTILNIFISIIDWLIRTITQIWQGR